MPSRFLHLLWLLVACLSLGCGGDATTPASASLKTEFVASIPPLAMILKEVAGDAAVVTAILPPGADPHTWEPKPSAIAAAGRAAAVFHVHENLDAWAGQMGARNQVQVFELVPEGFHRGMATSEPHEEHAGHDHSHGGDDPHFWMNPRAVAAVVGPLAEEMAKADPTNAAAYRANAEAFKKRLDKLDAELAGKLAPLSGEHVVLMHPSVLYLLDRYGIACSGVIEPSPGKEPTPRQIAEMVEVVKRDKVRALFSEPQLSSQYAKTLGEAAGVPVAELDGLGGQPGRGTYEELVRFNCEGLVEALK